MLFLPSIIIVVFAKKTWLRWIAGIIWFIGLLTSAELLVDYLIATGMVGGICYIIRWAIQSRKKKESSTPDKPAVTGVDEEIIDLVSEYRNAYEIVVGNMDKPRLRDEEYIQVIITVRMQREDIENTTLEIDNMWREQNHAAFELASEAIQFANNVEEDYRFKHLVSKAIARDLTNSMNRSGELSLSTKKEIVIAVHRFLPQDY